MVDLPAKGCVAKKARPFLQLNLYFRCDSSHEQMGRSGQGS